MRSVVSPEIGADLLMTRDTVDAETPASFATSRMVADMVRPPSRIYATVCISGRKASFSRRKTMVYLRKFKEKRSCNRVHSHAITGAKERQRCCMNVARGPKGSAVPLIFPPYFMAIRHLPDVQSGRAMASMALPLLCAAESCSYKYRPEMLFSSARISCGVPTATMRPPASPPPGPMSIT